MGDTHFHQRLLLSRDCLQGRVNFCLTMASMYDELSRLGFGAGEVRLKALVAALAEEEFVVFKDLVQHMRRAA